MAPVPNTIIASKSLNSNNRSKLKKERKQKNLLAKLSKNSKPEEPCNDDDDDANVSPPPKEIETQEECTVSIAVPGSILENAQTAELRAYVAGQIARAACIFRVDEIVVFDDIGINTLKDMKRGDPAESDDNAPTTLRNSSLQLARILQYLECPQYLRKFFFPIHKHLKYSGLLNPLDAPHHLRQQNVFPYREGVVTEKAAREGYCYVNVGLVKDVLVDKPIEAGVRVTVKLSNFKATSKKLSGTPVSPREPKSRTGVYWGYNVRIVDSIAGIFTKAPYAGGYDLTIGTSDRGLNIDTIPAQSLHFKHALVVFGGLKGLEAALTNDDHLNVDNPELLFDSYVNVLPRQGSRTIRTEEAIFIAMTALQGKFHYKHAANEDVWKKYLPQSADIF